MSNRVPGFSQEQMRAEWESFLKKKLRRTHFGWSKDGKRRPVYTDDQEYLYVLDQWHGDLEVLELRRSAGEARYIGSRSIVTDYETDEQGVSKIKGMRLGPIHFGGNHKFTLTGTFY